MTLPIDRTQLALVGTNQNPGNTFSSSPNKNSMTVAYNTIDELYGFVNQTLQGIYDSDKFTKLGIINVKDAPFNAKGDGVTDDTVAINALIASVSAAGGGVIFFPKGIYMVSSERQRSGNPALDEGCIILKSNVTLEFAPKAILKLVSNALAESRILKIYNVSNVSILGYLEIDGQASTVTAGSEHMHGIFISGATNVYIQNAYSHDTFGDNLFIGGTEAAPSINVVINNFRGVTAGRKNLVIHYVDKLHIGTANLDNSLGGMAFGAVGYNSLDLEPDVFTGSRTFYQRIDYLYTYGLGNDFTVGTTEDLARKWILDIGTFDCRRMEKSSTSPVLTVYALTLRIDKLRVQIPDAEVANGLLMQYDSNVFINDAIFSGGSTYHVRATASTTEYPKFRCDKLKLYGVNAYGVQAWGAHVYIGLLDANSLFGSVLDVNCTADQNVSIEQMELNNCASGKFLLNLSQTTTFIPYIKIGNISVRDTQATKALAIMKVWTALVASSLTVGSINNVNSLLVASYVGANSYFKVNGGGITIPAQYICNGTPEGMITAPIGSIAQRTNGGAGTTLYVKESGTGNTGWVAVRGGYLTSIAATPIYVGQESLVAGIWYKAKGVSSTSDWVALN